MTKRNANASWACFKRAKKQAGSSYGMGITAGLRNRAGQLSRSQSALLSLECAAGQLLLHVSKRFFLARLLDDHDQRAFFNLTGLGVGEFTNLTQIAYL